MAQSDTANGDGTTPVPDHATSTTPAVPTPDTAVPTTGRKAKPPEDDPMSPDYRFDTGGG